MTKNKHPDEYLHLFGDLDDDAATVKAQERFLRQFWDGITMADYPSFGILAFRNRRTKKFIERPVQVTGLATSNGLLTRYNRWDWDQYFCPNMFFEPNRKKQFARETRLAWCDVDEADPFGFLLSPSVVWETSPGRYQALWVWDAKLKPEVGEAHSRALAYRHGADKNGWPINKLLRIPGSINHKDGYGEPFIPLLHFDLTPIEARPSPFTIAGRSYSAKPLGLDFDHKAFKRADVLKKYRRDIDPKARSLIRHKGVFEKDRSDQIFHMVVGLHEVGATIDEIASVIWDSPYFQNKYPDDLNALHAELSRILSKIGGAS